MKKEEFFFDSRDGESQIYAVRFEPETEEVRAVVQIIHGMAEYVERYSEFAEFLAERGFVVTGEDHLGHGGSVGKNGTGYFCRKDPATVVVEDVHSLKKMTQERYPSVPYIMLGHSMGSFMLRNYLQCYGSGIQGAIIMGTGVQNPVKLQAARMLAGLMGVFGGRHRSKFFHNMAFGTYNYGIRFVFTPMDWLSRDWRKVKRYIQDPLCGFIFTINGFQTLFELIRRCQKQKKLALIPKHLPIFVVSGAADPVGDYGDGVKKVVRRLQKAGLTEVILKIYRYDRHELLNERDRETVMEELYGWICEKVLKQEQ